MFTLLCEMFLWCSLFLQSSLCNHLRNQHAVSLVNGKSWKHFSNHLSDSSCQFLHISNICICKQFISSFMPKRVLMHVLRAYIFVMKGFNWHQYSYIGALSVCPNIIPSAQSFFLNCFWLYYVKTAD